MLKLKTAVRFYLVLEEIVINLKMKTVFSKVLKLKLKTFENGCFMRCLW